MGNAQRAERNLALIKSKSYDVGYNIAGDVFWNELGGNVDLDKVITGDPREIEKIMGAAEHTINEKYMDKAFNENLREKIESINDVVDAYERFMRESVKSPEEKEAAFGEYVDRLRKAYNVSPDMPIEVVVGGGHLTPEEIKQYEQKYNVKIQPIQNMNPEIQHNRQQIKEALEWQMKYGGALSVFDATRAALGWGGHIEQPNTRPVGGK